MTTLRHWSFNIEELFISYDVLLNKDPVVNKVILHSKTYHTVVDIYEASLHQAIKEGVLYNSKDKMQTIRLTGPELKALANMEGNVNKLMNMEVEKL
jgi:hypothetical protein